MEQKDEAKRILCVDIDGNDDIADDDESVKYPSQGTIRCVIAIWLYMLLNKEADMTFLYSPLELYIMMHMCSCIIN